MTTLAANKARRYEASPDPVFNDLPMVASDTIFEGAALGENASLGTYRPLVDGDNFGGFAVSQQINAGAAAAENVRAAQCGNVLLTLTDTITAADKDAAVYATDDDTFSITDSGSDTQIGKIVRFVSANTAIVYFEAAALRSV